MVFGTFADYWWSRTCLTANKFALKYWNKKFTPYWVIRRYPTQDINLRAARLPTVLLSPVILLMFILFFRLSYWLENILLFILLVQHPAWGKIKSNSGGGDALSPPPIKYYQNCPNKLFYHLPTIFAASIGLPNCFQISRLDFRAMSWETCSKGGKIKKVQIILVSWVKLKGSKKVWDQKSGRSTAQDCFLGQVIIRRDLREKFTINNYVYVKKV